MSRQQRIDANRMNRESDATTRWQDVRYVGFLVAIVVIVAVVWRVFQGDVQFCRSVFHDLVAAKLSVARHIDWEHLQAMEQSIGKDYAAFTTDKEREIYREGFIRGVAQGFQSSGARAKDFTNWRVHGHTPEQITIAADYPKKQQTLLLVMSASGPKKLVGIQWLQ